MRGAFAVRSPAAIAGANVLLVDDVTTTGATADEATRVLLAAGAQSVTLAVLAKEPEIYRKRVAHVRLGLDFTRLMVETMELKEQYEKGKKQDTKIADRLRENFKKLKSMIDAKPTEYMGVGAGISQNWLDPNTL